MNDTEIIDLYWKRSESAITQTDKKYGKYCYSIAHNILLNAQDSEECVNDTYLKAWNSMPPNRPNILKAFLAAITRNISLDLYRVKRKNKCFNHETEIAFEELDECLQGNDFKTVEDEMAIVEILNDFLSSLSDETRKIFMKRYFCFDSIKKISLDLGVSESKVKVTLMRTREKLRYVLGKEGINI